MRSTRISSWTTLSSGRLRAVSQGFSLVELLVGLTLALCLAAVALPLGVSISRSGAREGDLTIQSLQARVGVARLERDLRLASAHGCPFPVAGPVLEASDRQLVFLSPGGSGSPPLLVEWEITGGALMRRWGFCPAGRLAVYPHSLYRDHKTMLEGIPDDAVFSFLVDGVIATGTVPVERLASIESVTLQPCAAGTPASASAALATTARVGR